MKDYLQHPEEIPANVQEVLDTFDMYADGYKECHRVWEELNKIGWTWDWYLDAQPYDLMPLEEV